ncbi:MAG: metallophosphoesterase family protein [Flavobacteriaceae bacterium]|nr:MAG: metallophosphoesterase family protein [Flavobacteriaceae bacterium]
MVNSILNKSFSKAKRVTFPRDAKIVFFSDLHKGDNSYADDFRSNMAIYTHAMESYFKNGFTYIELGDGIELWENNSFRPIYETYKHIFELLKRFYEKQRLYLLWGNHDMEFRDPIMVEKVMRTFFTPRNIADKDAIFDLQYHEGLILEFENSERSIFAIHGHQADYMNYKHWKFNRFFVRYFWKYLQKWFGISDPTSPAKNYKGLIRVERKLNQWIVRNNQQMLICGHTHRPRFPDPGDIPLFNDGSCVHPNSIIGIEIQNFSISLVKWHYQDSKGNSEKDKPIIQTILEGPVSLEKYL